MSNTLTGVIPDAFAALDVVSREKVGFLPAIARDPSADQVAIGATLKVRQTPANAAGLDATPAMALPSAAYQTIGYKSLTITKNRMFPFSWTGEEQKSLGSGFLTVKQDQIAQAIRACFNEMESDVAVAAKNGASRAYGSAGTAPFASDLSDPANLKKILDDNGAPDSDRSLIINTTAGVKVRTLTQLTKVNEAGSQDLVRRGQLLDLHNFSLRESAQVANHTKGTGTSYVFNGSHAIGATTIVAKTGSGTVVAGDVLTFEDDTTHKYVVTSGISAPGSITIAAPGLLQAQTDGKTITIGNNYAGNVAFNRNAIVLATRLRELPPEGDIASEREVITDPLTGISLELAYYPGFGMGTYMVGCVWGVLVVKPEHVALLLG